MIFRSQPFLGQQVYGLLLPPISSSDPPLSVRTERRPVVSSKWTPTDLLIIGVVVAAIAGSTCKGPSEGPYGPEDCTLVYYNNGPECE